ncbi:MAG: hypothetical protein ACOYKA_04040 [Legionellaceae bacterium]
MKKRYLILSLTILSIWAGLNASSQKGPMPTAAELKQMLVQSNDLKSSRPKVAISMRRIAIQMEALQDVDAKHNSSKTIRETVQELSDRLRMTIEKYERAKNVQVIHYYKDCGADDVTDDFIESMFPYPVEE